jgi:hypothetical protein
MSTTRPALTDRQQQVLDIIRAGVRKGLPPTVRELAKKPRNVAAVTTLIRVLSPKSS